MQTSTLDGATVFVAVAETRNFRVAGERLGVSSSAVSQSLRKLEERIGVSLVHRTTRSVRLPEAGERLYAAVRPASRRSRHPSQRRASSATSRAAPSGSSSARLRTRCSRGCRSPTSSPRTRACGSTSS